MKYRKFLYPFIGLVLLLSTAILLLIDANKTVTSATIYEKNPFGNTPLHLAVSKRDIEAIKTLIEAGVDINATDNEGNTALHKASISRQAKIFQTLIEAGADIHATDNEGNTALHKASISGQMKIFQILIEAGADIHATDNEGNTALHKASISGKTKIFQTLIEAGADIHATDNEGNTVLHKASISGKTKIFQTLIEAGADINATDNEGNTVLHKASISEQTEIFQTLIDAGVDIEAKNNQDKTALMVIKDNLKIKMMLIAMGANITESDTEPEILYQAIYDNDIARLKQLIDWGADVNAEVKTRNFESYYTDIHPLLHAMILDDIHNAEKMELLLNAGVDVESDISTVSDSGDFSSNGAPLIWLFWNCTYNDSKYVHPELSQMVKLLLQAGADVDAEYTFGSYHDGDSYGRITDVLDLISQRSQPHPECIKSKEIITEHLDTLPLAERVHLLAIQGDIG